MFIDYNKFKEAIKILMNNKNREVIDTLLSGIKTNNYIDWSTSVVFPELTQWLIDNEYECITDINMDELLERKLHGLRHRFINTDVFGYFRDM
jgi:orotate phosphoribosyltransferase